MFLGDERTPQALLTGLLAQPVENALVAVLVGDFLLRGDALVMNPFADAVADVAGLFRNFKVDGHGGSSLGFRLSGVWWRQGLRVHRRGKKSGRRPGGDHSRAVTS